MVERGEDVFPPTCLGAFRVFRVLLQELIETQPDIQDAEQKHRRETP